MTVTNIDDAATRLPELIEQAERGEQVILARDGRPVARLVRFADQPKRPRVGGQWRGRVHIADDFDAPLPGFGG
jgi:prevent-host-death family protein